MEPHDIIARDFAKNHQGREYDEAHAHRVFDQYAAGGGKFLHLGNVLIFVTPLSLNCVEFHCMNGGTGAELTEAVNTALGQLSSHFDFAFTYYDNPRINAMMKFRKYPVEVSCINDGIDRTFEARFSLKGASWVQ